MISKSHYIDLIDGEFHATTPEDLEDLFVAAAASRTPDHLLVYFHGGLVSRKSAEEAATNLLPHFLDARTYPVFFFWHSDLFTTLFANLDEIAQERVFQRLVRRLVQLVAGGLAEGALKGGARGGKFELESLKDIPADMEGLHNWASAREPEGAVEGELSEVQREQIETELGADLVLQEEARAIAAGLRSPAEIETERLARPRGGAAVKVSKRSLMSASILEEIRAEAPDSESRSAALLWTLARHGAAVALAVTRRYARKRDHGLLATVLEEVWRQLYLDSAGSLIWSLMKKDTADAFLADTPGAMREIHGGRAFVKRLAAWWRPGRRVTLVGHSTGAIYIAHLLQAADLVLPAAANFDIVFLAPAASFTFLGERLALLTKRVGQFRLFGLRDGLERGYWEVPVLYPASLLYLVSGLFEDPAVDMPIVGMQRYHQATGPYDLAEVKDVLGWIDERCVWSEAAGSPGLATGAQKHGGFGEDRATIGSLEHILLHGF
jgi:hypothetical protein